MRKSSKKIHRSASAGRRVLLIIVIIGAAVVALYLNRTYAHIYATIDRTHLIAPASPAQQRLGSADPRAVTVRYAALGDSLTAGVGVSAIENSYPYHFAEHLTEEYEAVELLNTAVPGARAPHVLTMQIPAALEFNPDIVTLLIGVNDMHAHRPPQAIAADIKSAVSQIIKYSDAHVYVLTVPYLGSPQLMYPPWRAYFNFQTRRLNAALAHVCPAARCTLVDIYSSSLHTLLSDRAAYSADLFHPTDVVYHAWVNQLIAAYAATHRPSPYSDFVSY